MKTRNILLILLAAAAAVCAAVYFANRFVRDFNPFPLKKAGRPAEPEPFIQEYQ